MTNYAHTRIWGLANLILQSVETVVFIQLRIGFRGALSFYVAIPAYLSGSAFDMQGNTLLGAEADGRGDSWNC